MSTTKMSNTITADELAAIMPYLNPFTRNLVMLKGGVPSTNPDEWLAAYKVEEALAYGDEWGQQLLDDVVGLMDHDIREVLYRSEGYWGDCPILRLAEYERRHEIKFGETFATH